MTTDAPWPSLHCHSTDDLDAVLGLSRPSTPWTSWTSVPRLHGLAVFVDDAIPAGHVELRSGTTVLRRFITGTGDGTIIVIDVPRLNLIPLLDEFGGPT